MRPPLNALVARSSTEPRFLLVKNETRKRYSPKSILVIVALLMTSGCATQGHNELVTRAEPRVRIRPVYPFAMRRSGTEAEVTLKFLVDVNGNAQNISVTQSPNESFSNSAVAAVTKWKFKPATTRGGKPVASWVVQTLKFSLVKDTTNESQKSE